jgi:ribosomal-protein-alanine N-acetyltransferase
VPLPPFAPLQTARLTVRPVHAADLPDLMAVNGDAEVTRFLPYEAWQTPDDAQAWLGRMATLCDGGQAHQLVIVRDGRAVGTVLLFRHEEPSARIELGYALGRAQWGQGIAREALAAVIDTVFGPFGLRRIEAQVQPDNLASSALLARLGFRREGVLRQRWVAKGRAYDVSVWGLLAAEHGVAGTAGAPTTAPPWTLSTHDEPPADGAAQVDDGIGTFNDASAPLHEVRPVSAFARAADGRVLGGAVGRRWGRCCELQQLWVRPELHGQGLGAALLRAFENHARGHGCRHFYLETFSFQAPDFYRRHGYRVVHGLDVYPHGIVRHLMRKDDDTSP